MSIRESIGKGFKITGVSMNLVAILFVFGTVWNLLNIAVAPKTQNPPLSASITLIVLAVIFGLVSIYIQAGSLGYILNRVKSGGAAMSDFTSAGAKFYLRLLVLGLLVALAAGVLILLAAVAIAATSGNAIAVAAAVLLALVGIYFAILIFLAPYIIVADDQKVLAAVKQSIGLVKKNFLKVMGLALILIVIGFGIGMLLGLLFAAMSAAMKGIASQIIFAVLSSFVNAYLGVVVSGSFMVFYLKLSSNNTSSAG